MRGLPVTYTVLRGELKRGEAWGGGDFLSTPSRMENMTHPTVSTSMITSSATTFGITGS